MTKYMKLPLVVEAFQMRHVDRWDNDCWPEWLNEAWQRGAGEGGMWCNRGDDREALYLGTLEGVYKVRWDDWIIKGIAGELYPCDPGIFDQSYVEAT